MSIHETDRCKPELIRSYVEGHRNQAESKVVALGEELDLISPLVKPWSYGYKLIGCFSLVDLKFFLKINIFKKELKFCSYF